MSISFKSNFNALPAGTKLGTVELNKIWAMPNPGVKSLYNADTTKMYFDLVASGRYGGNCFRYTYPKDSVGMNREFYQLNLGPMTMPVNVEYDWKFLSNFDLNHQGIGNGGGGKLGPCINWGPVGGVSELRGTRLMCWWDGYGSLIPHPKYAFVTQDQRSGTEWGGGSYGPVIAKDTWAHVRLQMLGGPHGWSKGWVNNILYHSRGPTANNNLTQNVLIDFASFFGGTNKAPWLSHALHDNVHVWTGN